MVAPSWTACRRTVVAWLGCARLRLVTDRLQVQLSFPNDRSPGDRRPRRRIGDREIFHVRTPTGRLLAGFRLFPAGLPAPFRGRKCLRFLWINGRFRQTLSNTISFVRGLIRAQAKNRNLLEIGRLGGCLRAFKLVAGAGFAARDARCPAA